MSYSGKAVTKAGEKFLSPSILEESQKEEFSQAMDVLSWWRQSHEDALDSALKKVQKISKKHDRNAIYAKRLKRYASIVTKLNRFKENRMTLRKMQDIGGCRVVVSSEKKLYKILRELRKNQEFLQESNNIRQKDYIKNPKDDGYRGVHIIGQFPSKDFGQRNIEVQLRTRIQHSWATALEIIDTFTGQALKSNQGDQHWESFFANISFIMSEMDKTHMFERHDFNKRLKSLTLHLFSDNNPNRMESIRKIYTLLEQERQLNVINKLNAFSGSLKVIQDDIPKIDNESYALIEINLKSLTVNTTYFPKDNSSEAETAFSEIEKKCSKDKNFVVALVSANAIGGLQEAYPNFFADSTRFLDSLNLISTIGEELEKKAFALREKQRVNIL